MVQDAQTLPRRPLHELQQASGQFDAVVAVTKANLKSACQAALNIIGSIIVLSRVQPDEVAPGAKLQKMQLVSRPCTSQEWRTATWFGQLFGDKPVELLLQGITVNLSDDGAVAMVAELREADVEEIDFVRFTKAMNLEALLNLSGTVFPIARGRIAGSMPQRVAVKYAGVDRTHVHQALSKSGLHSINIRLEHVEEEKAMKFATHLVSDENAMAVREKIKSLSHLGVVKLKSGKFRVLAKDLAETRKLLSPSDARYRHAPEVEAKRRWCISAVPLHVAPLRLSQAMLDTMSWRQIPLGSFKKNTKRQQHDIHVGSTEAPKEDTVIVDQCVCIIRELVSGPDLPPHQPRLLASDGDVMMKEPEEQSSAAQIIEKKV